MPNSGEAFPLTNDEIRRRRLQLLTNQTEGGAPAIAAAAKVSAQNLDHILKRRKQKARADGSQPLVMMGDKLARDIEAAMSLAPGWLDWPFLNVPYERFAALGATGRAVIEGRMIAALEDAAKLPAVVQQADRKAVTDKRVEEHIPALDKKEAKAAHARARAGRSETEADPADPRLRQQSLLPDQPG